MTLIYLVDTPQPAKPESSSLSGRVFYAAKSTKIKEKRPGIYSPRSSTSSGSGRQIPTTSQGQLSRGYVSAPSHVAAVLVPPPKPSPAECRRLFLQNLRVLDNVTLANTVDDTSPPLDFKFIKDSVLGTGVTRTTKDFMSGCTCAIENGRSIGCMLILQLLKFSPE